MSPAFTHRSLAGRAAAAAARQAAVDEIRRGNVAAAFRLDQSRRHLNLALDPIATVAHLEALFKEGTEEATDAG